MLILLSLTLCLFANTSRWAELADLTTVRSFRDYWIYNGKIAIAYNFCWALITLIFYLVDIN